MNILITGATGLLGRYLISTKKASDKIIGLYFGSYAIPDTGDAVYISTDIQHKRMLEAVFNRHNIDAVIHAAGIANVDFCETQYEIAYLSNVVGTQNVIDLCSRDGARLVFISSNAVFDGENAPYKETDRPNPITRYGEMKLECEEKVARSLEDYLIARPILMYGWNEAHERGNLVTHLLESLPAGKEAHMVNDVFENPLYARQCAEMIWALMANNMRGIYHLGGMDTVSRYEYALAAADIFNLNKDLIKPVDSSFFPHLARRPKNTSYDTWKASSDSGIGPIGIVEGLRMMKNEI